MATAQSQKAPKTPAAVKAAAAQPAKAPRVHKAPAGTVEGPNGKKLADHPEAQASKTDVPVEQRKGERRQQLSNTMEQFKASAMQTPAVHEPTEEEKKALAFQEAVKALATTMGVDATALLQPKQARAPRADKQQQNGVTRPNPESTCGKIWALADQLTLDRNDGHPVEVAKLRMHADMKQVNDHTLKTQIARWRAYNGFKGRTPMAGTGPVEQPEQQNRRADDPKPEAAAQ